ncbi:hypothetical protein [Streptomyces sp. MAA16]|uniref:hypothetical protein n=1 Tax=Streptomyces sp. MAA16 TaxID=3035116 RepID=UPI002475A8B2|nr:hypothetical protein [Streptomyces sp. MAA16]MDH6698821.1 hypothetical protein [Streptomyces sp. MAA16]
MSDRRSERSSEDEPTSSIPDEEWERFVRDSEQGSGASVPKEPSARAREVAARLKSGQGARPEGRRTGPDRWEPDRRATRRRRRWTLLGVPLALVVAVVAMRPSLIPGDPFGAGGGTEAAAELPAETAAPTAAPGPESLELPTLDRPFAGSPARRWADGAAGIVLPKATAVGDVPAETVQLALEQTRKLLVDANLNPAVVAGGHPKAALSVLDPEQPDLLDGLKAGLRSPSEAHDPVSLISRFDPDEVRLVGDVIKTRGRTTVGKGEFGGVRVRADYTFVYPVVRSDGSTEVTRTIVRRVIEAEFPDPERYRATPGLLTLLRYDEDAGNSTCDVHDGYLHPEFPSRNGGPAGATPSGRAIDPYDRSREIGKDGHACGTLSRT